MTQALYAHMNNKRKKKDFALLERFSGDAQGQVLSVNHTTYKDKYSGINS
jgi:hypothetical protein